MRRAVFVIAIVAMIGCGAFLGLDEPETPNDDASASADASTLGDGGTNDVAQGIMDASSDGDASDVCVPQGGNCGAGAICCAGASGLGEAFTCTRDNTCGLCTIITEPCDAAVIANPCCEPQAICAKDPNDLQGKSHCCWPFRTPCDNDSYFKCCSGNCKADGGVDGGPGCALK